MFKFEFCLQDAVPITTAAEFISIDDMPDLVEIHAPTSTILHQTALMLGFSIGGGDVVDVLTMHREILNARLECNDIVIFIYGHYPLDPNAKSSDTICVNLSIKYFWIRIKRLITVY